VKPVSLLKLIQGDTMKKQLFIILPLILALAFITCQKEPESPPEELTLDQRLVGGRWYFSWLSSHPVYSMGYYEFTSDSILSVWGDKAIINGTPYFEGQVYSKNGIVYSKEHDNELLRYEFHTTYPYDADDYTDPDNYLTSSQRSYANHIAKKGNLISCTPRVHSLYPDNVVYSRKFLVRFNEGEYKDYED
jgi:hypothetical protein